MVSARDSPWPVSANSPRTWPASRPGPARARGARRPGHSALATSRPTRAGCSPWSRWSGLRSRGSTPGLAGGIWPPGRANPGAAGPRRARSAHGLPGRGRGPPWPRWHGTLMVLTWSPFSLCQARLCSCQAADFWYRAWSKQTASTASSPATSAKPVRRGRVPLTFVPGRASIKMGDEPAIYWSVGRLCCDGSRGDGVRRMTQ